MPAQDPSRIALPFLPPESRWHCLIRASASGGGMVVQDAPSRPIRVTVTFAGAASPRDDGLRSARRLHVPATAGMESGAEDLPGSPRSRGDRARPGDSGKPNAPTLPWAAQERVRLGDRRSPGSTGKCCAQRGTPIFRASCLSLCRRGPHPFVLDFPVARFPPCPRREAVRQERARVALLPCQTAPILKEGRRKAHHERRANHGL